MCALCHWAALLWSYDGNAIGMQMVVCVSYLERICWPQTPQPINPKIWLYREEKCSYLAELYKSIIWYKIFTKLLSWKLSHKTIQHTTLLVNTSQDTIIILISVNFSIMLIKTNLVKSRNTDIQLFNCSFVTPPPQRT